MDGRYSEALERQVEMLRFVERSGKQPGDAPLMRRNASPDHVRYMIRHALTEAAPYYWAPALCDVLAEMTSSLPLDPKLPEDVLPSGSGFCWFARPLRTPCSFHANAMDEIVALSWTLADFDRPPGVGDMDTPGVWWTAYVRTPDRFAGEPIFSDFLPFQVELHEWVWNRDERYADAPHDFTRELEQSARALVAGLLLMNQRVFVTPAQRVDRAARRSVERAGAAHEPVVRVVELRRREYERHDTAEQRDVEWSCRWLVRGHWRRLDEKTVWVRPHVKGPDDRPLKRPRAEVFAVVR